MKRSNEKLTQGRVDQIANRLLKEANGDIDLVTGNRIATAGGMTKGNESVYEKHEDLKDRKLAEGLLVMNRAPPGLREYIVTLAATLGETLADHVTGGVGKAVTDMEAAFEKDRAVYRDRISELEDELAISRKENEDKDRQIAELIAYQEDMAGKLTETTRENENLNARLDEYRIQHQSKLSSTGSSTAQIAPGANGQEPNSTMFERFPIHDMRRYDHPDD